MPDYVFQLLGLVGSCVAVYSAIKSDLAKAMHTAEKAATDAESAHERLDRHIEVKH